jgi:hypothetical protein
VGRFRVLINSTGDRASEATISWEVRARRTYDGLNSEHRVLDRAETADELRLLDLLKDDLVHLLVGILRLAATRGGQPQTWRDVTDLLGLVASPTRYRKVGTQLEDDLTAFLAELCSWFAQAPLEPGAAPDLSEQVTQALTDKLAAFVNLDSPGSKRIFGDRPEDIQVTLDAFKIRVAQVLQRIDSWDAFSDAGAVPLLTIHRSKASSATRCSSLA